MIACRVTLYPEMRALMFVRSLVHVRDGGYSDDDAHVSGAVDLGSYMYPHCEALEAT